MIFFRRDPEIPAPLDGIWRKLKCLSHMHYDPELWSKTDQQHIDSGYCLDRYSLIDPVKRDNHDSISS